MDIGKLVEFHRNKGKIATITSVMLEQLKGVLEIGEGNLVTSFREKSDLDGSRINAGYMVLEPEIFDYLKNDSTIFEKEPMTMLAQNGQLAAYKHNGFWQCMDTKREMKKLEELWQSGKASWKKWED